MGRQFKPGQLQTGSLYNISASYALSSSYATTASFYNETDPIFTSKSASLATTGSNTFYGNQILSGSGVTTTLQLHGENDSPWAFGLYNDTYNPTQSVLAGFIWNDGRATIGTEINKPLEIYTNANYYNPTLIISSSGVTINNKLQQGDSVLAFGTNSHAEGLYTIASGSHSHAEGTNTVASGNYSHAEGSSAIASGFAAHAEGYNTRALGNLSHAEGYVTIAKGNYQHVQGQFNISSSVQSAFILGNGIDDSNRSNLIYAHDSTVEITGSLEVQGGITGSLFGTSSYAVTASYAPAYLPLTGGTIAGNVTINGTASISFLDVTYESASVIYSSGSNQFGDATDDVQTLIGTVIVSGSQQITGSLNVTSGITGSLQGTATFAETASNILGGKATHIPYFITDTTLATSSIFQSGSTSVIINQDNNTTANPEALYVWQPHPTSINVVSGKGNLNNYLQLNIQNTNQGTAASSDIVATANNGNETTNYIDMGINSENFSGLLGGANDAYLYSTGNHLHIGNATLGQYVGFFAGGDDVDTNMKLILDPYNIHQMTGSLRISGSLNVSQGITGSLFGTSSYATRAISASYADNAGNATNAVSASYSLNSSNANTATSASYATLADNALTANFATNAGNGGVTNIIAGSGVTLIPSSGVGAVTIVTTGGGGVTIISGSNVTQSFNDSNTWVFNHNLGIRTPTITVFDSNYNQIIPENITLTNTASATITFPTLESGFAVGMVGGVAGNAYSSSYSLYSTYASTASFYNETDPVFVAKSASLATTGSNIFKGNQTVTGSVYIASGSSLNLNGVTLYASSSTLFTNANFVPTQHNTQSLGTTAVRWKDIWLGAGSLYIADNVIPNSDLVIEAINNILVVSGSAGLEVGSFKFVNNELFLKNEAIPIIIGSGSATAPVQLKRPLEVISGDTGNVSFEVLRDGHVTIYTPSLPNNDPGAFSVVGSSNGYAQTIGLAGRMVHITGNDGLPSRIENDSFGTGAFSTYIGRSARGVASAPSASQNGDILSRLAALGYGNTGYLATNINSGPPINSIDFIAKQNYNDVSASSAIEFYTSPQNARLRTLSATIDTTGITIPTSSRFYGTASWAENTITASYAQNAISASYALNSTTASYVTGSIFKNGNIALSSSYATTASYVQNAQTASYVLNAVSASYAQTASYVLNAVSASYVLNAISSSFSTTSSYALSSSYAQTASYALNVQIINTSSFATTGSNIFIGNQTITGSLTLNSGSALNLNDGLFVNGNQQFQYASFYHTASQTITSATVALPFQFSTIENNSGAFSVNLSGSRRSRITTNTTGWWNIQYSAQVQNSSGFNDYDSYVWVRVNEVNIPNSNNIRTIPQNAFDLLASRNTLIYLTSGSYFEIIYGASNTAVSFPYTAAGASPTRPATPSITLVVTQHA